MPSPTDGKATEPRPEGQQEQVLQVPRIDWTGQFKDRAAEARFRRFHWRHSAEIQIFFAILLLAYQGYLVGFYEYLKSTPDARVLRILSVPFGLLFIAGAVYRVIVRSPKWRAKHLSRGPVPDEAPSTSLLQGEAADGEARTRHDKVADFLDQTNGYQWAVLVLLSVMSSQVGLIVDCVSTGVTVACRQLESGVFPSPPPMHTATLCLCQLVGSTQPVLNFVVVSIAWGLQFASAWGFIE
jgi:hypothetical protein